MRPGWGPDDGELEDDPQFGNPVDEDGEPLAYDFYAEAERWRARYYEALDDARTADLVAQLATKNEKAAIAQGAWRAEQLETKLWELRRQNEALKHALLRELAKRAINTEVWP